MVLNTSYFGKVTYNQEEAIHFEEGLFGFPQYKDYLPLAFDQESDGMICLQSIEDQQVSFILMNPFGLSPSYQPRLSQPDLASLAAEKEEDLSYYVICVIGDVLEKSTVNLRCPVAVNAKTRQARQVILEDAHYSFRHPLKAFLKKEGEAC